MKVGTDDSVEDEDEIIAMSKNYKLRNKRNTFIE
jgi:hypothetical protein